MRVMLRSVGALLSSAFLLTLLFTGPARAAAPDVWGFALADQPATMIGAWYTPTTSRQWGSWRTAFPADWAEARRNGVGVYEVRFPHIGVPASRGIVHVTSHGFASGSCQTAGWTQIGTFEHVRVLCYTHAGVLTNSQFTILFTSSTPPAAAIGGAYGYVYADQPLNPSYNPANQYNSAVGPANVVDRLGVGNYHVGMPGAPFSVFAGHVQVTADNGPATRCKSLGINPAAGQHIRVICVNPAGAPVDSPFTVSYLVNRSILGDVATGRSGYLLDDQPALPFFVPGAAFSFNSAGFANNVTRLGVGQWDAFFPQVHLRPDNVQVTAFGGRVESYCRVAAWTTTPAIGDARVRVLCFNAAGALVDTPFMVSYLSVI